MRLSELLSRDKGELAACVLVLLQTVERYEQLLDTPPLKPTM